jgi:hypothetical protein
MAHKSTTESIGLQAGYLTLYTLLAAIGTYPLIFHAGTSVPAGGDSWTNYWNLWWVKRALLDQHSNPFFSADVHFPQGASLYFHTLNFLPAVIALPLTATVGIAAAFNFLVLLSYLLTGYGTYRLVLYILNRESPNSNGARSIHVAAFLAGVFFTFSTYRYIHVFGHLDLLSTQWLPFFTLFFLKTRHESGWKHPVIAAAFLIAAALTAFYYVMFLLVLVGLVIAHMIIVDRSSSWPALKRLAAMMAIFAVVMSPLLLPMMSLGTSEGRSLNPAYDIDRFSADLLSFVLPSPAHSLWRPLVDPLHRAIMRPGNSIEVVTFLGFIPMALSIYGLKQYPSTRRFWLPLTLMFGVLALGPVVYVAGRAVAPQLSAVMPYRLLSRLPYGDIPRVPARFAVMVSLCVSVIGGFGAAAVLRNRSRPVVLITGAALTILAIGENAVVPFPLMEARVPAFFHRLHDDERRAGLLEVPIPDDPATLPERMLYQTVHHKPIYGGYLARGLPPLPFSALPGFAQFKTFTDISDDVVAYDAKELPAISRAVLNVYSVGWIAIEKYLMQTASVERARQVGDELLGRSAVLYEDDQMLVYTVPTAQGLSKAALWLDTGWSYLERLDERDEEGRPLRWHWMNDQARIALIAGRPTRAKLVLHLQAFRRPRRLQLSVGNTTVATLLITPARNRFETPTFEIPSGINFMEVKSLDGADSPGLDARRLSAALFRLELHENE